MDPDEAAVTCHRAIDRQAVGLFPQNSDRIITDLDRILMGHSSLLKEPLFQHFKVRQSVWAAPEFVARKGRIRRTRNLDSTSVPRFDIT